MVWHCAYMWVFCWLHTWHPLQSNIMIVFSNTLDSSTPWWNKFARIHTDKQAPSECTVLYSLSLARSPPCTYSPFLLTLVHSLFAKNHSTFHMDTRIHTTWTLINYSDTDILHLQSTHRHHPNTQRSALSLIRYHTVSRSSTASSPHFHTYECSSSIS